MKKSSLFKRGAAVVGAGAVLVPALLIGAAGSAGAATTSNQFTLCATGNYTAQVVFTDRGGFSSFLTPKGTCWTDHLSGISNEHVDVFGYFNTNPGVSFKVGSFSYNDSKGGGVDAGGTTTAPRLLRW